MKKRYENNRWKAVMAGLSVTAMIGCVVCGSLAWLTAKSTPVVNTFDSSVVDVTLTETKDEDTNTDGHQFKMIPGWTNDKDPKASVVAGSEDCYLFVEIIESTNLKTYIEYAVDEAWTALGEDYPGVYYIEIDQEDEKGVNYSILGKGSYTDRDLGTYSWQQDQVLVKPSVDETLMKNVRDGTAELSLTFKAYAVQLWKKNEPVGENVSEKDIEDAKFNKVDAWNKRSGAVTSPSTNTGTDNP